MAVPFTELVTSIGVSLQDAETRLEQHAAGAFLGYFRPAAADGEAGDAGAVEPITQNILLPGAKEGESAVALPVAAMAHHNTMHLDTVTIRLNAVVSVRGKDHALMLETGPLCSDEENASKPPVSEFELVFRGSAASEGVARVNQSLINQW